MKDAACGARFVGDTLRMGSEFSGAQGEAVTPIIVDYYAILSCAIEAAKANPGHLRSSVYDLARASLYREAAASQIPINGVEYNLHRAELERAIQKIETEHRSTFSFLPPRVDFAIQIFCAIVLLAGIIAVATGYLEVYPAKHATP